MTFAADPKAWIGRSQSLRDPLAPGPAARLAATLGRPAPAAGAALPPLWHWIYFLEAAPPEELGRDGHPKLGGFLPPIALPRRMWAGGRLCFHAPLPLGAEAEKRTTILSLDEKEGRSGPLVFLTLEHKIFANGTLAVTEEQDIVYREDPAPGAPQPAPPEAPEQEAEFRTEITPTSTLLFRYSALTFNGHRIHYDADYARQVEGYAAPVVHGPLLATLLAGQAASAGPLARFSYRARAPITLGGSFSLCQKGAALWITRQDGATAMDATFAPTQET